MVKDISRNTIFVLVILTLIVTALGTWTVLNHIEAGSVPVAQSHPVGSGEVQFVIGQPSTPASKAGEPVTGQVSLEITG